MKVSDLRIGVKLGAGFLAVVLLTTVLGLIALVQMSRIHANAEEIATNLLPSVAQTGDLRVLYNLMRRSEAGMVTARSLVEVKAFSEQVALRAKDIERVEKTYEPLIDSPKERESLTPTKNARPNTPCCRPSWSRLPTAWTSPPPIRWS